MIWTKIFHQESTWKVFPSFVASSMGTVFIWIFWLQVTETNLNWWCSVAFIGPTVQTKLLFPKHDNAHLSVRWKGNSHKQNSSIYCSYHRSGRKWPGYNWSQRTLLQMLSFKPVFSFSSFNFIKSLFSSSSLSAIMVVSSEYLRLLIFLLAVLIPACTKSSPAFCMMYSAYKLNKQGDNIHHWCTHFPVWN